MKQVLKAQVTTLFESLNEKPNAVTYKAMETSKKDENMYSPYDNIEDLMDALNN